MFSPLRRGRLLGVVASASVLAGLGWPAHAEPAPPFGALLRAALRNSPRLAEGDAEVDRASGLALQAQARPNPSASLYVENFVGSDAYAALGGQTTLQVDQALELGGKRPARIAAGRATLEAARATRAQARLAFAVELATNYALAEASERRVELARQALELATEDLRVARLLVETGKEAGLRSVQAEAEVSAARARVDRALADSAAAFATLSAIAASPQPITSIPDGLLKTADAPATAITFAFAFAFAFDSSPAYQTALAEREAAARRVRVERTQAVPNLTVSAGVRDVAGRDVAGVVGLSMPIPVFDQNRGNISAAQASLRAAEARLTSVRLDLEADARSASARVTAAESQLVAAKTGEAAAEEAYRLTRLGYVGGKLPLLEVLSARRALTEARTQTLDARLARLSAASQLSRLAGRTPFGDQP